MERVLSLRELNRALLVRQLLLDRGPVTAVEAVERITGMQAQWGPSPYVGLWSRVDGFRREELERAYLAREVLRATLMRGTVHLVSIADYGVFGAAVAEPPWLRRDAAEQADRLHHAIRQFGSEPRTRREVEEFLVREHGVSRDQAPTLWYGLRIKGRLTHAPETGLWRPRGMTRYVAAPWPGRDPEAARVELVRRYLGAWGPATRADVAAWSGLRVRDVDPALDALEPLARFRDEGGRELLDLPGAPLPPPDTPAPVRLLPRFDNLLLAHRERTRVLPERYRRSVIEGGMVYSAFLVDGFVAGLWEVEQGRVRLEPFAPLPARAQRELEAEAKRLEAWLRDAG